MIRTTILYCPANSIMKNISSLQLGRSFTAQRLITHRVWRQKKICIPLKTSVSFHTSPRPSRSHGHDHHPGLSPPETFKNKNGAKAAQVGVFCELIPLNQISLLITSFQHCCYRPCCTKWDLNVVPTKNHPIQARSRYPPHPDPSTTSPRPTSQKLSKNSPIF